MLSIADQADLTPIRISLKQTSITGSGSDEFSILLSDAGDSILMQESRLEFPSSVTVRVLARGQSQEGGRLEIVDTSIGSVKPEARILFGVGDPGFARLERFAWQLESGRPVLFAGTCVIRYANRTKALCKKFDVYEPGSPYDQD